MWLETTPHDRLLAPPPVVLPDRVLGRADDRFTLLHITGDPAALLAGDLATPDILQQIRHAYGLDQPLPVQYVQFLGQIVQGNFGYSYRQSLPVLELIGGHIGPTIELAVSALVVTVLSACRSG